jgi:hypothetical protein
MITITIDEYFGPYKGDPSITTAVLNNATILLDKVNDLYEVAHKDGCELLDNPKTKSGVSGSGNGGYRTPQCIVGAPNSTHKLGQAVDRYDPFRQFQSWCLAHESELQDRGLYMEDTRWTPTWVHLQCVPPHSMHTVYIPSADPALTTLPPDWSTFA